MTIAETRRRACSQQVWTTAFLFVVSCGGLPQTKGGVTLSQQLIPPLRYVGGVLPVNSQSILPQKYKPYTFQ
jgi:hypothetical protein